jgi:adenylosuccinate synthase
MGTLYRNVDVIVGGQYGSEGKGNIVSKIAHKYAVMVRTGGPNAGHQVVYGGKKYTFHHLPSGSLHNKDALLVLGAGAVIHPQKLLEEMDRCNVEPTRVFIHPQAMIIYDDDLVDDQHFHGTIGSTAQGVGVATVRKIRRGGGDVLAKSSSLYPFVRRYQMEFPYGFSRMGQFNRRILVEGTQGTMLSLHHGHWPHVTSRDTTVSGVLSEAGIPPGQVNRSVMVVRTYPIRVQNPPGGTSGPMPYEITWAEVARRSGKYTETQLREAERTSTTGRQRRVSEFSMDEFLHAYHLNGPTDIALTFADYMQPDMLWRITSQIVGYAPISLQASGPTPADVHWQNEKEW